MITRFRNAAACTFGMLIVMILLGSQDAVSEPSDLLRESWPAKVGSNPTSELSKKECQGILNSTTDELRRLIDDDRGSLALTAAWEQARRESMTDGVAVMGAPLDRAGAMRFLGLVEGRIKMRPPQIWENSVLSGAWNNNGRMCFKLNQILDLKDRKAVEEYESQRPVLEGDHWVVTLGDRKLDIPEDYVTNEAHRVAYTVEEQATYFVVHEGDIQGHGTLHRLEKGRQIPKWRAHVVCTRGEPMSSSGPGIGFVRNWVCTSKAEVAVFTVAWRYCAIEVFEKESGRNVMRFLSDRFDGPFLSSDRLDGP